MNRPMREHSTYAKWRSMINRCTNPNEHNWHRYGGRGITVDPRWLDFANFYADMGDPPPSMTLERKKNHLGYSKENCVWATAKEQANNRDTNRLVTFRGETRNIKQWSEALNMGYAMLYARVVTKGWPLERAFTEARRGAR